MQTTEEDRAVSLVSTQKYEHKIYLGEETLLNKAQLKWQLDMYDFQNICPPINENFKVKEKEVGRERTTKEGGGEEMYVGY
jgi:hypothetical protein